MDIGAVLEAAEKRFQAASRLEQESALDYYLLTNSCQHFLRSVLGAGGPIPDHYFPKHFVTHYLERYLAPANLPWPIAHHVRTEGTVKLAKRSCRRRQQDANFRDETKRVAVCGAPISD